jgi:thiamine pyrophosphate-dependent acetolactate synthase large subunit-like protein
MADQTTGGRLADLLHAEGIDTLFSIPDPSYAAVHKRALELGMKVVGPRHESAGVHMADGLSRMTGRPQAVMAGMGPGVANLVPGVTCAWIESIPVIVIATQRVRSALSAVRRGKFQFTPQIRMFEPITKYAAVVEGANRIDEIVHEAFRLATTGRPGPVYIEIPGDVMNEVREFPPVVPPERYRLMPQAAPQDAVENAADMLRAARLPLVVAGTGIHTSRSHAEFRRLAEILRCPVVPSPGGRGSLPDTHPQVLPFLGPGETACREADCVLTVGSAVGEPLHFGAPPQFAPVGQQRWITIERDPGAIGLNREYDLALVGDLREVIPQLTAALEKRGPIEAAPELETWRGQYDDLRRALAAGAPQTEPIHTGRAVLEIREAVVDDAVIVRDGGAAALFEAIYGEQRSNDFLWTSKFGHLGTGLPYAIGAQLAVGTERRVCLISGDSALGFNLMELETAVRHSLPVLVVVLDDHHWGMEVLAQEMSIGRQVEAETTPLRLDRIAEGFGAFGVRVEKTAEIRPAIEAATASGKPAIVQIVIDPNVNARQMPGIEKFAAWYAGNY